MTAKPTDNTQLSRNHCVVTLEDDPLTATVIEQTIGVKNHWFTSVKALEEAAPKLNPLGAFIDIHLDGECGLDVLPMVRALWPSTVIIVMTGDDNDLFVAQALSSGADDFIRKPVRPVEIQARLKARLEDMHAKNGHAMLGYGDLTVDIKHRVLKGPSQQLSLSSREIDLIAELIRAQGLVVSKKELKQCLWRDVKVSDNALDRKIFEVRKAIKQVSKLVELRSVYGVGIMIKKKVDVKARRAMADPDVIAE